MEINVGIEIKKFTLSQVMTAFYKYIQLMGFTGNLKTRAWYTGYVCALRDAKIISHDTWNDLTDRINDDRLFKAVEKYARNHE